MNNVNLIGIFAAATVMLSACSSDSNSGQSVGPMNELPAQTQASNPANTAEPTTPSSNAPSSTTTPPNTPNSTTTSPNTPDSTTTPPNTPDSTTPSPTTSISAPNPTTPGEVTEANAPSHPDELLRVWDAAEVRFQNDEGDVLELSGQQLVNQSFNAADKKPVVIYLHGCSGFWRGSDFRINWFAEQGFVAVAPDSFARSFYPESCNLSTMQGWQYKPTIAMRQFDLAFALDQLAQLPWVDTQRVFIYGFSEGGLITAIFSSNEPSHQVNARIIESWNCLTIPWTEYQGLNVLESEPVLSLFADQDPWLQNEMLASSCGDFISTTNGSQALLIDYAPLNTQHPLLESPDMQEIVLNFMLTQSNAIR